MPKGDCEMCDSGIAVVGCRIRNMYLCMSCADDECNPYIDHQDCYAF